jgi:glycosyltransferase involved in cell wall biosynthesis
MQHQVVLLQLERRGAELESRALPPEVHLAPWRGGQRPARWQDGPALWLDLKRVIREVKPDLIHAGPVQTAGLLAALSGFHPLVIASWGSDLLRDADRNGWYRWATRTALGRADALIGDCQIVRQKALQFGFPSGRIVIFPWGVDLEHFSPEWRQPAQPPAGLSREPAESPRMGEEKEGRQFRSRLGWDEAFALISTRSWEPVYGVDVVAQAFVQAARDLPELRLFMLGTGSQAGMLRRIFEQGDVLDRVYFGGQVDFDNLPRFYRASDLYLGASHSDGSSVSLMEALACGLPVAISDIPGNREWISDGVQGWFFPDGDAAALADRIRLAVSQKVHLGNFGQAARALAEQRADWSKNSHCLLQAYQMALDSRR